MRGGAMSIDRRDRREPYVCPYCHRIMSNREHDEQGACNDCAGGAVVIEAEQRYPAWMERDPNTGELP